MAQLFLIAIRNIIQHRRRSLLLGVAIGGVTALFVFLLCLSSGIRSTVLKSATTVMTGHINIAGFYKISAGQAAPLVVDYKAIEEIVRKNLPHVDFIAPRGRGWGRIVSDMGSLQSAIAGIDLGREPGLKKVLRLAKGNLDDLSKPNTIVLFEDQAKKLEVTVGDKLIISVLTPRGANNTIDVKVVGVAQEMGLLSSFSVFIPDVSLDDLYHINTNSVGALQVYLKNIDHLSEDLDKVRSALADAGYRLMDRESKPFWAKFESVNREDWTGQKIDLTTWDDEMSFIKWVTAVVDGLMYVLTTVLLIIISIGIMNSMWIAIRERTREIGTLRAIGMQRLRVMFMFLIEAFTLSALASVSGAIFGLLVVSVLGALQLQVPKAAQFFLMSNTLGFTVEAERIFSGILVIVGCTTIIAIIPSLHAARLKPITAMQHIG